MILVIVVVGRSIRIVTASLSKRGRDGFGLSSGGSVGVELRRGSRHET